MNRQNVTLSIDKDILRRAKIIAIKENMSLSEFVRKVLSQKVKEGSEYNTAKNRQLKFLKTGFNLATKGTLSFCREYLYDRR